MLTRFKSAFVNGGFFSNLSNFYMESQNARLLVPTHPQLQRIVATKYFAGSQGLRQDCVIIEAHDDGGHPVFWVARILALFRICNTGDEKGEKHSEVSYAFLQYFETVAPRDEIDEQLHFL